MWRHLCTTMRMVVSCGLLLGAPASCSRYQAADRDTGSLQPVKWGCEGTLREIDASVSAAAYCRNPFVCYQRAAEAIRELDMETCSPGQRELANAIFGRANAALASFSYFERAAGERCAREHDCVCALERLNGAVHIAPFDSELQQSYQMALIECVPGMFLYFATRTPSDDLLYRLESKNHYYYTLGKWQREAYLFPWRDSALKKVERFGAIPVPERDIR